MRSGKKNAIYRAMLTQKKGYPLPHTTPESGPTDLVVLHNSEGYYVGTEYRLSSGALTPHTRESSYMPTKSEAQQRLKAMTGKLRVEHSVQDRITDFEVFDVCDAFFDMLEDKFREFERPPLNSTQFTRIEKSIGNIVHDLLDHDETPTTTMDLLSHFISKKVY